MNELNHCLEEILGIHFPEGIKISNATNSTDKVKEEQRKRDEEMRKIKEEKMEEERKMKEAEEAKIKAQKDAEEKIIQERNNESRSARAARFAAAKANGERRAANLVERHAHGPCR